MLVYEISKKAVQEYGSTEKAIVNGYFVAWDNKRIKNAFNNGNGTIEHFRRYTLNNMQFCYYIDMGVNV